MLMLLCQAAAVLGGWSCEILCHSKTLLKLAECWVVVKGETTRAGQKPERQQIQQQVPFLLHLIYPTMDRQ